MADNKEVRLKSGDMLFGQGDTPDGLYMVQGGCLEILSASDEFSGLDKSIVLSKSSRVGLFKPKSLVAGVSEQMMKPYSKSVRAVEDSVLVRYPLRNGGMQAIASSDLGQAVTILKQLYNNIMGMNNLVAKYSKLYHMLNIMNDNIAIMYRYLSETNASDVLHSRADSLFNKFKSNGGNPPPQFNAQFLVADNSNFLSKRYELPPGIQDTLQNRKVLDFIVKFLKLNTNTFAAILKADPSIAAGMYDIEAGDFVNSMGKIEILHRHMNDSLNMLFGDSQSWTSYLADAGGMNEWQKSGKMSQDFIKNLLSLVVKINLIYEEVSGKKLANVFPGVKKIHDFYSSSGSEIKTGTPSNTKAAGAPAIISTGSTDKSIHQIFEFAVIDKEFQNKFLKLLNDFKTSKNPFNTESDGRKMRRNLTKFYWDLFKQVYVRSMSESAVPKPVQLMIRFGFLDEGLVDPNQINELNELIRLNEKFNQFPVLYEREFLNMIMKEEEDPSITEMGLNYDAYLREQEKHSSRKKKKEEVKVASDSTKKVLYEIEQRLSSTAAICSGSTATAFPILTSLETKGSLKSLYNSKQKIEGIINDVRNIDFSLFYRETVLKLGEAREIISEEVIPYFIMLPIYGTKTLLWQELSGTNKRSRGRVVIPIFFMGDLKKSLTHTFACFRWELSRTMKGAMWADPIEGGVTGEYFDYVNTFKKMSKLSSEAKEKVAEKFKSLRTNRDRFADDYINWIMYEKDGIMKQNAVVREMFFKHIPFRKDIRERLEKMPAFSHAANRFKNIQNRTIAGYERRFKKYQSKEGTLPVEIVKYFEFLRM